MKSFITTVLVTLTLFLSACSSDSSSSDTPTTPAPTIQKLDIEPKKSVLVLGTTEHYRVIATYSDFSVEDVSSQVTWSLAAESGIIESYNDPDSPDLTYAIAKVVGGDSLIATLNELNTTAKVEVIAGVALDSLVISPTDANMSEGTTEEFTVVGTYDNGHTQDLTDECNWTSTSAGIASVSDEGVVTALVRGTTTIEAALDGINDSVGVTVYDPTQITRISIVPENLVVFLTNNEQYLHATLHFQGGTTQDVSRAFYTTWLTSNPTVAAFDSSPKNRITGLAEGNVTVYVNYGTIEGNTSLQVKDVEIEKIIITPVDQSLEVGESRNYYTEALGDDGKYYSLNPSDALTYKVDDERVASIGNMADNKGVLNALTEGTSFVRARFVHNGREYNDTTPISVVPSTN